MRQKAHLEEFDDFLLLHEFLVGLLFRGDLEPIRGSAPHGYDVHAVRNGGQVTTSRSSLLRPVGKPSECNRTSIVPYLILIFTQLGIVCLALRVVHSVVASDVVNFDLFNVSA